MKRTLITSLVSLMLACQPAAKTTTEEDAGATVEYQGETNNTPLPQPEDVPQEEAWEDDAGAWVIDRRCCDVVFHIDDLEPADATGLLLAPIDGLRAGLPLTRNDAGWTAGYCMPLNAVIPYHYEFTWADPDAGATEDGGTPLATSARASQQEFHTGDWQGGEMNVYVVNDDCSAADASVSMRP